MIIGIVAISKNYAIGKGGKLPWHYPADLKFFKKTTLGNVVVMGSNTWRSIGRPLPDRINIVLTRSNNLQLPPGVIKFGSKSEVLAYSVQTDRDVYIIGGAKTYSDFDDVIDEWIVTYVPDEVEDADTFMPRDFLGDFELEKTVDLGDGLQVKILHRK